MTRGFCAHCGGVFGKPVQKGRPAKYCSQPCRRAAAQERVNTWRKKHPELVRKARRRNYEKTNREGSAVVARILRLLERQEEDFELLGTRVTALELWSQSIRNPESITGPDTSKPPIGNEERN